MPFACSSAETGQESMKEVQGASMVKIISLKTARNILSRVVNEYADYKDLLSPNEANGTKTSKLRRYFCDGLFVFICII